ENVVVAGCHGPDGMDPSSLAVALEAWNQHRPLDTQPWLRLPIALAEYRLGHFAEVFQQLEPVQNDPGACVVLAMTYYRQGHNEEAKARLEQARAYVEGAFENADRSNVDYVEWPTALYREAARLIQGDSSDIDARYEKFRDARRRM